MGLLYISGVNTSVMKLLCLLKSGMPPADMPDLSKHNNFMTEVLTPEMYNKLKMRATVSGTTLAEIIKTGVDNPGHPHIKTVGAVACDEESYEVLSYGLDESSRMEGTKNVLVFDLGGGTFDASLLEIDNGVFEVKATGGDTRLGGEDFDQSLLDWAAKECEKKHGVDPRKTARSARRLQTACERAKRMLSSV